MTIQNEFDKWKNNYQFIIDLNQQNSQIIELDYWKNNYAPTLFVEPTSLPTGPSRRRTNMTFIE